MLALLQQSKSSDNVSNQVYVIPSNMTTQTGNNFISSFSSLIIDSGATDHICSSLTYFTLYHQINPIYVKLPNGNQVIVANYSGSVFLNQNHVIDNVLFIYVLFFFINILYFFLFSLMFFVFSLTYCITLHDSLIYNQIFVRIANIKNVFVIQY